MYRILKTTVVVICVTALGKLVFAQSGNALSPYFNQNQHSKFIEYALNSGMISLRHTLNQPFLAGELSVQFENLKVSGYREYWSNLLQQDLIKFTNDSTSDKSGYGNFGLSGSYEVKQDSDEFIGRYRAEIFGYYTLPYLVLAHRTAADQRLAHDPLYHGDTDETINGRVEDAYALFKYKSLKLFGGRISRNFGIFSEPSLILSDNPYSYDHFSFELDTKRIKFYFLFTRLNDIFGFDSKDSTDVASWRKRYFSLQRLQINLLENLEFAVTEAAIYGGENQNSLAYYLNPLNLFLTTQNNQSENNPDANINGIWSFEAMWKPKKNLTLFGQFLVDDMEFIAQNRGVFPNRLGGALKMVYTDLFTPGTQFSLKYNRISNWTYISFSNWENYLYYKKSLGYPNTSVENISLGFDYFGRPPFLFSMDIGFEQLGDQDFNNVFIPEVTDFPIGVVQKSVFINASVRYFYSDKYWGKLNFGLTAFDNAGHIEGKSRNNFYLSLQLNALLNRNLFF